jgi:hypothetical protein
VAFLYNQGCHLVDTEIKLNQLGLNRFSDLDNHSVIDVLGIGLKYFSHGRRRIRQDDYDGFTLENPSRLEYGYNILRGIEVKVSRSDFRNGFVCSGCNYHYVLAPMRLVASHEVPRGVGLIEFNRYKFSCELNEETVNNSMNRPFTLRGLRVVRRPVYRNIPQFQIDNAIAMIGERSREQNLRRVKGEIQSGINKGLVYVNNR